MNYLYIDTTSSYLYSAVINDDKVLYEINEDLKMNLSTFTMDKINNMFKSINMSIKDIDEIIVVNGPGSFTGIRIGVTIAKTLAHTLNISIKEISSLTAMRLSDVSNNIKVPLIDARRNHVYASIYDNNNVLLEEQYISLDDLNSNLNNINKDITYISNDTFDNINTTKFNPNYNNIINYIKTIDNTNPHLISPNYLKKTEAEEKLNVNKDKQN